MKIEIVDKLVANLQDKKEYVIHIRNLQQVLGKSISFEKKFMESLSLIKSLAKSIY